MKDNFMRLKLNKKEVEVLKKVLSEVISKDICEKSKPDYEEKVGEDYDKYAKLHRESAVCKHILDIIEYLQR